MSKVTLGGERLGAGKKMKVDLHGFERSTHDLSYIWRSTMSAGTLVPFMREVALPGDTFDIELNCDIKTHPTIGPLFGSYKVQLDVFVIPMRLYMSGLHNNMLNIGMNMSQIKLPKINLAAQPYTNSVQDLDNFQVNPSSIFSYLGIRGVGIPDATAAGTDIQYRKFNAIPLLAYWDIYKQYYANKQEEEGVVIHTPADINVTWVDSVYVSSDGTDGNVDQWPGLDLNIDALKAGDAIKITTIGSDFFPDFAALIFSDGTSASFNQVVGGSWFNSGLDWIGNVQPLYFGKKVISWSYALETVNTVIPPNLVRFPLSDIDNMRQYILATPYNTEVIVNDSTFEPYTLALEVGGEVPGYYGSYRFTQEGLGVKTYQSDLFNNWLSTDWIDGTGGINEITAVDTSGGFFNIDTLNLSRKVYDMLNRIAVSGGTYDDWLTAVYDHESWNRAETPVYLGGLIKELVFQEVVSNSQNGDQPLGTLAGKGVMAQKHKGGKIVARVDEPSYLMGIISLTPRVDYSQGNKWDVHLSTMDDLHKPSLDQIGFQELITEQMAWWSTNKPSDGDPWATKSAGKQPAWINYMTNVNEVRGNFAISDNEMFMTLNRKYEALGIGDPDSEFEIKDLTTYIDPSKFNHIFAQTSLDAQNFWAQISVDMIARRKMSAKVMPNL